MIRIVLTLILGCATALYSTAASAADEPNELAPGRILLIKNGTIAKFVAKAPVAFDLPDANNAPTVEGASLSIFDTAGPAGDTYALPAGGWKGLGNPAGSAPFPYTSPALFSMTFAFIGIWLFSVLDSSPQAAKERDAFAAQQVRSETGLGASGASGH